MDNDLDEGTRNIPATVGQIFDMRLAMQTLVLAIILEGNFDRKNMAETLESLGKQNSPGAISIIDSISKALLETEPLPQPPKLKIVKPDDSES